jgi:hypothetical protein
MRHRILKLAGILSVFCFSSFRADALEASDQKPFAESFQLCGAVNLQEKWRFSLRNVETDASFWLELGATVQGLTAVAYDTESKILTLAHEGAEYKLRMVTPDSIPLAVIQSPAKEKHTRQMGLPPVPEKVPPAPPNGGLPPKLPAPTYIPKRPVLPASSSKTSAE